MSTRTIQAYENVQGARKKGNTSKCNRLYCTDGMGNWWCHEHMDLFCRLATDMKVQRYKGMILN